ncbi:MAG: hypothetical protein ACREFM_02510, partial [Hypericibacter sp.]
MRETGQAKGIGGIMQRPGGEGSAEAALAANADLEGLSPPALALDAGLVPPTGIAVPSGFVSNGADPVTGLRADGEAELDNEVYAAIDLGTNNCRLLVARARGRGFRVIDAFSRIVR